MKPWGAFSLVLVCSGFASIASADCSQLVESVAAGKERVHAIVSTLNLNGTASFMDLDMAVFRTDGGGYRLDGVGKEFFGDRKKADGTPFDPAQTDDTELEVLSPATPVGISVLFNLNS